MKLTLINDNRRAPVSNVPPLVRQILRVDFLQLIPMLFLLGLGLFYIYSTGHQVGGNPDIWKKQLFFVVLGLSIWLFLAYIDYKIWAQWALIIYGVGVLSLVLVLLFGVERYGAKRWFSLLGLFSVQPSEFAKIATLILSAWVLSLRNFDMHNFKHFSGLVLITAIPFLLIYKEPDLGSSIIFLPILAAMVFVGKVRWKWILITIVTVMIMIPGIYPFLRGYQKERILVFLDPSRDPTNKGWNSRQSQLAVGSGGPYGKGIGNSTQSTLGFLPKTVANSDFIFSVIAEETGFVGSAMVLLSYLLIILSAFRTAVVARDDFGKYIAIGIGVLIFIHSFVNIGMTIRMMPVTGLPLPLVSLGGSFIISTMISLGLLQSIYIRAGSEDD
jgi:rod shape determining protein RodA